MKKSWVFIFLLIALIPIKSRAYVNYKSDLNWIDSSCLGKNKCIALCSYYQVMQNTPATGVAPTSYYSGIYIYYYFDGKYQISWDKEYGDWGRAGKTVTKKGKAGDVFTDSIFISDDRYKELTKNVKCPKYAYISGGDVCFDNGKYCAEKNGILRQFTSSKKQQYSDYDINDDMKNYFDNWSPSDDVCTSIDNCDLNKIKDQFNEDFSSNFLHGNKIPTIIQNNEAYKNGLKSIEQKYENIKKNLIDQVKNDNSLTETQKEQKIESINQMVESAITDFEESVKAQLEYIEDENINDACEVIPQEIKAWIINILKVVRYIALALVIVLGALDFMKASSSGEPDQMKKAGQSFLKRVIAVVILFLLPYIVELILNLIDMFGVKTNCIDTSSI